MEEAPEVEGPNMWLELFQGTSAIPKAVAKLIATVGDQIGLFLEPTHIRRIGAAHADVSIVDAQAKSEIAVIEYENKHAIKERKDRATERVRKKEERRQRNLEDIAAKAFEALPDSVSDHPVDPDWVTQFFEHCQDVSDDQMKSIWAKLLAGEVATPGAFSYRTLAAVKQLKPNDAMLFSHFCSFLWQDQNGLIPILPAPVERFAQDQGLTLVGLLLLRQLGLIEYNNIGGFNLTFSNPLPTVVLNTVLHYYGKAHLLQLPPNMKELEIGHSLLTDIGRELAPLSGSVPNGSYQSALVDSWREKGIAVSIM